MYKKILLTLCFFLSAKTAIAGFSGDFYMLNSFGVGLLKSTSADLEITEGAATGAKDSSFINFDNELIVGLCFGYNITDYFAIEASTNLLKSQLIMPILTPKLTTQSVKSTMGQLLVSAGLNLDISINKYIDIFITGFGDVNRYELFNSENVVFGYGGKAGINIILKEFFHINFGYTLNFTQKPSFNAYYSKILVENTITSSSSSSSSTNTPSASDTSILSDKLRISIRDDIIQSGFMVGLKFIL